MTNEPCLRCSTITAKGDNDLYFCLKCHLGWGTSEPKSDPDEPSDFGLWFMPEAFKDGVDLSKEETL